MTTVMRAVAARPDELGHSHAFRPDIEGLRAVAVLAVVAFHFFPSYLPGGYLGVDVFFVISGYLITGVILRNRATGGFSPRDFYARRIRRLFPAMLVVLAACMIAAFILMFSFEFSRFARHITASLLYVQNFNLSSELGYFDHDAKGKPLLHFWSLAIEEQFYIIWPIVLLAIARTRQAAIVAALMIGVSSFVWTIGPAHGAPTVFFDPLTRVWELATGSALAAFEFGRNTTQRPTTSRQIASVIALVIVLAGMAMSLPEFSHPGWPTLLPVFATSALIACGPSAFANRRVLSLAPAVYVGRISYALYLWHWPLLAFPFFVVGDKPSVGIRLALLALSFALAAATWRWIEKPARARSDVGRVATILLILAGGLLAATWTAVAWRNAKPDDRQSRIEHALEGPLWAFTSNETCANRYNLPPNPTFCMLSQDREPTLLLVGNSFANHLYHGFATDTRTRDQTILSIGSCNHMEGGDSTLCRLQTEVARNSGEARILVVSQLWPEFTADGTMVDPLTRAPIADAPDLEGFMDQLREWISGMARPDTVILIVGPKPELPYDAKMCFDRPFKSASQTCRRPADTARSNMEPTQTMLQDLAAALPSAHYVDIADLFCRDEDCSFLDSEGMPLLRDNGHFSRAGSRLVVSHILDQVAAPIDAASRRQDSD